MEKYLLILLIARSRLADSAFAETSGPPKPHPSSGNIIYGVAAETREGRVDKVR